MKMFAYDTDPKIDFNGLPFVKGFEFRHDESISKEIGQQFSSSKTLFPDEFLLKELTLFF